MSIQSHRAPEPATQMNASCHTYMGHVKRHVPKWFWPQSHRACHTYGRVMTHLDKSCRTSSSETIVATEPTTHMNVSCHVYICHVTRLMYITRINVSCHIYICHVTRLMYITRINVSCHISISRVTRLIHVVTCEWGMSCVSYMSCQTPNSKTIVATDPATHINEAWNKLRCGFTLTLKSKIFGVRFKVCIHFGVYSGAYLVWNVDSP